MSFIRQGYTYLLPLSFLRPNCFLANRTFFLALKPLVEAGGMEGVRTLIKSFVFVTRRVLTHTNCAVIRFCLAFEPDSCLDTINVLLCEPPINVTCTLLHLD